MNRYLVVSSSEDEFYHDFVLAETEHTAKNKVLAIRTYCDGADAVGLQTLRTHLECLSTWTDEQIQSSWQQIVDNHDEAA